MRDFLTGNIAPMRLLAQEKVHQIKEATQNHSLYVETNHTFIKGFGWFIPELLPEDDIGVIILTRNKSKITRSYLRVGASPLEISGRSWLMTPNIKDPIIPPPKFIFPPAITYKFFLFIRKFIMPDRVNQQETDRKTSLINRWITRYELACLSWYVDETFARGRIYQEKFKRIRYYEVDIEELNTYEQISEMLSFFGHQPNDSIKTIIGSPTNLRIRSSNK